MPRTPVPSEILDGQPHLRRRRDDRDEPTSMMAAAFRFANDHGPLSLIAVAAFGLIAWLLVARLDAMNAILNLHSRDTAWYQRQTCISLAVMAGTPKELCDPPGEHR